MWADLREIIHRVGGNASPSRFPGGSSSLPSSLSHPLIPPPSPPGELPVNEGDRVAVLEDDQSGWVRARVREREGYVPLSYIQYATA